MNEKMIQIIPAPENLMYAYDGGEAKHVVCLALVERESGEREIVPMGVENCEYIAEVEGAVLFDE